MSSWVGDRRGGPGRRREPAGAREAQAGPAGVSPPIATVAPSARSAHEPRALALARRTGSAATPRRRAAPPSIARDRPRGRPVSGRSQSRCVRSRPNVRRVRERRANAPANADPARGRRARRSRARAGAPRARPRAQVMRGRALRDGGLGVPQPAQGLGRRAPCLGRVGRQAPKLDAVAYRRPRQARASRGEGRSAARASGHEHVAAAENGCAAKPMPPAARTGGAISSAERPACGISRSTPKAR